MITKLTTKDKRIKRVRMKVRGDSQKPRLTVFKSHRYLYGQIIDDSKGKTLVSASTLKSKKEPTKTIDSPAALGKLLADKAKKAKIHTVVFDRGGYKYHGLIKALAQGAREGGLKF